MTLSCASTRPSVTALDPLYRPLRRVIPMAGMLDLTPLVAIIVLIILQRAIVSLG